jgi:hypothetical protein
MISEKKTFSVTISLYREYLSLGRALLSNLICKSKYFNLVLMLKPLGLMKKIKIKIAIVILDIR